MPREEFKADDGSTVILTDAIHVSACVDPGKRTVQAALTDVESGCGLVYGLNAMAEVIDFGKVGQADAKVRLMIELPPDKERG